MQVPFGGRWAGFRLVRRGGLAQDDNSCVRDLRLSCRPLSSGIGKRGKDQLFESPGCMGKGGLHQVAESFAQPERACAYGEELCIQGQGIVEFASQGEELSCAQVMGRQSGRLDGGNDGCNVDEAGSGFRGAIDENHRFRKGDFFGQFRGPLLTGQDAHTGFVAKSLRGPFCEPRPEAVIFTECVAAGEDEASGWSSIHGVQCRVIRG